MATITSTPTGGNLTVNGTTQVSGTISWSKPTIPSGATISSCVLTGTATASLSKGSATITVNGTTVTSRTQFTINLGTANNTTSVTTTAKGGNKQSKGTVSFSNLVYTVTYEEAIAPKPTYTVTFKDWDGTTLKTQTVEEGASATAPSNPSRVGYNFIGWDKSFNNITANMTITAQYSIKTYTVIFKDDNGSTLKTQTVNHGSNATAPSDPSKEGYTFVGWDVDFSNVTSDLFVIAQYKKLVTTIEWSGLGTVASGLKAHAGDEDYFHDSYKVNLDWENESFDIIITGELNRNSSYFFNIGNIGNIEIGDNEFIITFSDGNVAIYNESMNNMFEYYNPDYMSFPFVISFTKDGIYAKSSTPTGEYSTPEFLPGSENTYEFNQSIYLIDDGLIHSSVSSQENPKYNIKFDLVVNEYSGQTEEPEEDVIEWTGIGTVATNLSTEDVWTYKLNIDWDTQYVEINNVVAGVELFNYGANVLYLNNEYDLSTGDLIYCDETSMLVIDSKNDYEFDLYADEFSIKISKDNGFMLSNNYSGESFTIENYPIIENSSTLYLSSLVHKESGYSTIEEIKVVALEEPEEPVIPVEKTIALRPISATQDSGYNNTWTDIANTYDTDTSTNGTIIVTGSSQSGFKRKYVDTLFNFDNPIPADAIINSAVLTIRAKQSATTNLNMTVSIGSDEVIGSTLLSSSSANYTADVANYVKDLNQLNINLTSAATSNRTFTLYDVRVDVNYTVYEMPNPIYTVTFKDWDGTILKTETVEEGASATAPNNPSRDGYEFTGWDVSFSNVTSDLVITAQYKKEPEIPEFSSSFMFNGMPINIMFLGEDKIIAIFMGDNKLF